MSRIARALEILEAINKFYQEGDCTAALSGYALILDDDTTIADAIAECLGPEECGPIIPRSQRRNYGFNIYTKKWVGYTGKRKVAEFETGEEALRWVNEA